MSPPAKSDEFDLPPKTLRGQAARTIERICLTAARWSIPLFIPVGGLLLIYVFGGYTAVSVGIWTPGYDFLSLSEDIYFACLGFGITICVGTGSLIGLAFLREGEGGTHTELSILFSFVGFGFGAGIVRMTYLTVLATLF
jgi:hypothetical protein